MRWLRDNKAPMQWKKHSKNKDKIDGYTDHNDRKSKWKKSALTSKCLITKKEYRQKYIYSKTNHGTKSCLKNIVERQEIVENNRKK